MASSLNLQLPCRPSSLHVLRAAVDTLELPPPVRDAVKLIANELLANSIRHSGLEENDLIEIAVHGDEVTIRVEVTDNGNGFTARPEARVEGGLGLPMVQRLSQSLGISHNGTTQAWAEISLDQPAR